MFFIRDLDHAGEVFRDTHGRQKDHSHSIVPGGLLVTS
nr:hypothetical protein [uncultured organism]